MIGSAARGRKLREQTQRGADNSVSQRSHGCPLTERKRLARRKNGGRTSGATEGAAMRCARPAISSFSGPLWSSTPLCAGRLAVPYQSKRCQEIGDAELLRQM